ncbi:hypothetical protein [Actinomyces procaprae]|uniref:hypothetical protein n=1 Tax=Actinomyces procaprae TaxID=2560010 RepID=UPI0010A2064A|nr:hypothetical protein [Actinomyces procaprae]
MNRRGGLPVQQPGRVSREQGGGAAVAAARLGTVDEHCGRHPRIQAGVKQVPVRPRQDAVEAGRSTVQAPTHARQCGPLGGRPDVLPVAVVDGAEHVDAHQLDHYGAAPRRRERGEPGRSQHAGQEAELLVHGTHVIGDAVRGVLTYQVDGASGVVRGGDSGEQAGHHGHVTADGGALHQVGAGAPEHRYAEQSQRGGAVGEAVGGQVGAGETTDDPGLKGVQAV